jgi:hypothetical protein
MEILRNIQQTDKVVKLQVLLISLGLLGYELISFVPAKLGLDSRVFTVPYRAFYLAVTLLCLFTLKERRQIEFNNTTRVLLLFWGLYIARLFHDTIFAADEIYRPLADYWLFAVALCFLPMIAFLFPVNSKTLHAALLYSYIFAVLVNVLGYNNNLGNTSDVELDSRKAGNEFLNAISYGQAGANLVVLSICMFFRYKQKSKYAFLLLLPIPFGLINIGLSGSRGPFIQLMIAFLVFFFLYLKSGKGKFIIIFLLLGFIALYFSFQDSSFFDILFRRLSSTSNTNNTSDKLRYEMMRTAWNQFEDNPIFGDLIEVRKYHFYPHNLILESMMACGLLGGICMLILYVSSLKYSFKLMLDFDINWIAMICIMQIVGGLTTGSLFGSQKIWFTIALLNNYYVHVHKRQSKLLQYRRNEWIINAQ